MAHIVWKMLQPRMNRFGRFAYIHWWYMLVLLLLIQTLSIVDGHPKSANDGINDRHGHQRFAMEPQDQTGLIKAQAHTSRAIKRTKSFLNISFFCFIAAIVGSRVTLPCRVVGKQGTLQWTKDDFGLGWHRNLSGFERYTMIGSDEEGDFSLGMPRMCLDLFIFFFSDSYVYDEFAFLILVFFLSSFIVLCTCRYLPSNARRRCSISMPSRTRAAR